MEQFSLSELGMMIQQTIKVSLSDSYWVKAEIAQIKENYSGHCYLELVEKNPHDDRIVAQSKAMIWSNTYRILKPYFQTSTKQNLCAGIKILVRVKVDFHSVFGLSLIIHDIDPAYTMGDIALRRANVIRQLQEDGIFNMNREVEMPLVTQRVAIISSETAAGYLDFITHLLNNPYGYKFHLSLFPAFMQGEKAEYSIIEALNSVFENADDFDVVAIIRGGGSQTDLSCFDAYELASNVAQFPLPVITGIGHEQDESITDMVACIRMKTPTAAAEFLVNSLFEFECRINENLEFAVDFLKNQIAETKEQLYDQLNRLPVFLESTFLKEKHRLHKDENRLNFIVHKRLDFEKYKNKLLFNRIENSVQRFLHKQNAAVNLKIFHLKQALQSQIVSNSNRLNHFENIARLSDPDLIMKKGFSITLLNSKLITDASQLEEGNIITTRFYKGDKQSRVIE